MNCINRELLRKLFKFQRTSAMLRDLYNTYNKQKNNNLVDVIKSGLRDLKGEIEKMSEDDIEIEKP